MGTLEEYMTPVEAKCAWICENDTNLLSVIKVLDNFPNNNILDLLNEDACVSLKCPETPIECSIGVFVKSEESHLNSLSTLINDKIYNSQKPTCDAVYEYCKSKTNFDVQKERTTTDFFEQNYPNLDNWKVNPLLAKLGLPGPTSLHFMGNNGHKFSKTSNIVMTEMLILSEAKFIEIYTGSHEEYFETFHSELILDVEESKIYKTEIVFAKPVKNMTLKLKGLFSEESVWIYGIFIRIKVQPTIIKAPTYPGINSAVNCNDITSILKERKIKLSEKAESFKKLMEMCGTFQHVPNHASMRAVFSSLPFKNKFEDIENIQHSQLNSELEYPQFVNKNSQSGFKHLDIEDGDGIAGTREYCKDSTSQFKKYSLTPSKECMKNENIIKHSQKEDKLEPEQMAAESKQPLSNCYENLDIQDEVGASKQHSATLLLEEMAISDGPRFEVPLEYRKNEDFTNYLNFLVEKKFKELEGNLLVKLEEKMLSVQEETKSRLQNIEGMLVKLMASEK